MRGIAVLFQIFGTYHNISRIISGDDLNDPLVNRWMAINFCI